jgi:hypothetical protein
LRNISRIRVSYWKRQNVDRTYGNEKTAKAVLGGTYEGNAMLEVSSYVLTVYGYVPREVWLAYLVKRG